MNKPEIFKLSIYYEDTDSSGFVYHTSYLKFAERARTELVKKKFSELKELMEKNLFFFVVSELKIKFLEPSFLNDELEIETHFEKNTISSIELLQQIKKNKNVICKVNVKLVWINGITKKPSRIPKNIIARFNSRQVV